MSVDYTAVACLGVQFSFKDFRPKTIQVRGCEHPVILETAKFCPECGSPIWTEVATNLTSIDDLRDTIDGRLPKGYVSDRSHDDTHIVGLGLRVSAESWPKCKSMPLPDAEKAQEVQAYLRKLLEPYGLWDEGKFRLWVGCFAY